MKKLLSFVLSFVLLISMFSLVGCGDNALPRSDNLPDFAKCKVGYKLKVYPKVPFNYEMSDGTIVHISSIEATLTAKNEIKEGDTIKGYFYPYEVTIQVSGSIDKSHAGKTLDLRFSNMSGSVRCSIDESGKLSEELVWSHFQKNQPLFFSAFVWW